MFRSDSSRDAPYRRRTTPWNTGATVSQVDEFISDDAAIVAMLLRRREVRSALIGTTLGHDPEGRQASQRLRDMGIVGEFPTSPDIPTPYELNISDRSGGRTYFWKRDPEVLATLAAADSSGWVHIRAPELDVVDACGAGAALSAGYLYGLLKSWSMDECLRFAVAASSLSCTDVGPKAFPTHEIRSLAASLSVETGTSLT